MHLIWNTFQQSHTQLFPVPPLFLYHMTKWTSLPNHCTYFSFILFSGIFKEEIIIRMCYSCINLCWRCFPFLLTNSYFSCPLVFDLWTKKFLLWQIRYKGGHRMEMYWMLLLWVLMWFVMVFYSHCYDQFLFVHLLWAYIV